MADARVCVNATEKTPCLAEVGGIVPACHVLGQVHQFNRRGRCKTCKRSRGRAMSDDLNEQIRNSRGY